MPSKWERFYSRICFRRDRLDFLQSRPKDRSKNPLRLGWPNRVGTWVVLLLAFPISASAVISMSPNNGGSLGGTNTYYYFVQGTTPLAPAFMASGVTPLSLVHTADSTEAAAGNPNRFEINFRSDVAVVLTGTQQLVVTFQSYPITPSPIHPAPIATVNGKPCDSNLCQGLNAVGSNGRYYAVKYSPRTTMRIGFYPQDICEDFETAGGVAIGCTDRIVKPPSALASTTMQLSYAVTVAGNSVSFPSTTPGPSPTPVPVAGGAVTTGSIIDQTTGPISFIFENMVPRLICPAPAALNNSVLPGDGQIFMDTSGFGVTSANPSAGAPAAGLVVVGQDSADPVRAGSLPYVAASDYASKNSVAIVAGMGSVVTPIVGLKNTTDTEVHTYKLSFIGRDQAGLYVGASPVEECLLDPVETSTIQGFLKKSNCFIATAAFGSIDAAPVVLLREFRDTILLPSSLGRSFVHWYYGWSPPAAEWLMLHPVFRLPVLLLLSPLEVIAWLSLHLKVFYFLFALFTSVGGFLFLNKRKKELR